MNFTRAILVVLVGLVGTGCGPAAPSGLPCETFDVSGRVTDDTWLLPGQPSSSPIEGARVTIVSGAGQGATFITSVGGYFVFAGLAGVGTRVFEAVADGFESNSRSFDFLGTAFGGSTHCVRATSIELGQEPHTIWGDVLQGGEVRPIVGARVEIIDGPNAGVVALTDESSQFRIDGLLTSASFRFSVSAEGYQTRIVQAQPLRLNSQYQFRLFRQ